MPTFVCDGQLVWQTSERMTLRVVVGYFLYHFFGGSAGLRGGYTSG